MSPLTRSITSPAGGSRFRVWTPLLAAALAVTLLLAAGPLATSAAAARCQGAKAQPGEASIKTLRNATRCLLNRKRAAHGLGRTSGNGNLTSAATGHSRDMVRNRFFSHTSRNGDDLGDRVRESGYLRGSSGWSLGEVIAWGSGTSATPASRVRAWMRSSGHRSVILSGRFRDIGVGLKRGSPSSGAGQRGSMTYTVDFGRR
jgi:uncharacterized protein YkwD